MTSPPTTQQQVAGGETPATTNPAPIAGIVTILTALDGKRATKIHRRDGQGGWKTQGYDKLYEFSGRVANASNLKTFMAALVDAARNPGSIAVAEAIRGEVATDRMRRLAFDDKKTGDSATLCPHPEGVRWICWEIDHVAALPDWFDPSSSDRSRDADFARWWIKTHLHPGFQGRSAILQWSASALLGGKVSLHLWQWLDRPVSRAAVKAFARAHWKGRVDLSVWDSARVHYIAAPIFEAVDGSGMEDPLAGWRWQWVQGEDGDDCEAPTEWVDQPTWERQLADAAAETARAKAEFTARAATRTAAEGASVGEVSADETGSIEPAALLPLQDLDPKRVIGWARSIAARCASQIGRATKGGADGRHPTARSYALFFGNVLAGLATLGHALSAEAQRRVSWSAEVSSVEALIADMEAAAVSVGDGDPDRARVVRWGVEMGRLGEALLPDYRTAEKYRESAKKGAKVIPMKSKGKVSLPAYEDQPAVEVDEDGVVIESELGSHAPPAPPAVPTVRGAWPSAPCAEGAVIPEKYFVEDGAIYTERKGAQVLVSNRPIIIAGRLTDEWGAVSLHLAWPVDGRWVSRPVPRSTAQNKSRLVDLSDYYAPVDSGNAAGLVAWLSAYEHANSHLIPKARVTPQMGWHGEGAERGFLLGNTWIGANGGEAEGVDATNPTTWRDDTWMFDTTGGDGDLSDARAFNKSRGSLEGWLKVVEPISKYPRALLALYASFAAPLVNLLDSRTFILDFAGKAGSGKTTLQSLAASVWGNPDEISGGIITGWSSTKVGAERTAGCLKNLPLILNDSSKVDKRLIEKAAFELSEGEAKTRGAKGGGRQAKFKWRTGVISSGEQRLVDYAAAADAGVRHRVIQLHGNHWGGYSQDVATLTANLWHHHGHAGKAWIRYLVNEAEAMRVNWHAAWTRTWQEFEADAAQNTAAVRLGKDLAVISIACALVHIAIPDLPWDYATGKAVIDATWQDIKDSVREVEAHVRALRMVWEWCVSNQDNFEGGRRGVLAPPAGGWLGRWSADANWGELAIIPSKIEPLLAKEGYSLESLKGEWARQGWTVPDKAGGPTAPVWVGGGSVRCIVFRRDAVDANT